MSPLRDWFRPSVLKMKGYTPGEQPKDPKTLKLNTNENPYTPPAVVLKAARHAADLRLRLYPEPTAETLRKRLAEVYRWPLDGRHYGPGMRPSLDARFFDVPGFGALAGDGRHGVADNPLM